MWRNDGEIGYNVAEIPNFKTWSEHDKFNKISLKILYISINKHLLCFWSFKHVEKWKFNKKKSISPSFRHLSLAKWRIGEMAKWCFQSHFHETLKQIDQYESKCFKTLKFLLNKGFLRFLTSFDLWILIFFIKIVFFFNFAIISPPLLIGVWRNGEMSPTLVLGDVRPSVKRFAHEYSVMNVRDSDVHSICWNVYR